MDQILMGIDASTTQTGISIFEIKNHHKQYQYHALIAPQKKIISNKGKTKMQYKEELHQYTKDRIEYMIVHLQSYFRYYHPSVIIMEDIYLGKDPYAMKMLSRLQGAVLYYALQEGIQIQFKTPTQWRAEIGFPSEMNGIKIKREEFKKLALNYVKTKYHVTATEDEAEAICIGDSYHF